MEKTHDGAHSQKAFALRMNLARPVSIANVSTQHVEQIAETNALKQEELDYLRYHKERIAFNVKIVSEVLERAGAESPRLLDVGPHIQTTVLNECVGSEVVINTLGWKNERLVSESDFRQHFEFDLNNADTEALWPETEQHDVVVMAEVIEHLHTAPSLVINFLKEYVAPGGYLIIQTPNAVDAKKRLQMLRGEQPYEQIQEDLSNPGHFREYTKTELREYVEGEGLDVEDIWYCDYWPQSGLRRLLELAVPSLRRGITLFARKP